MSASASTGAGVTTGVAHLVKGDDPVLVGDVVHDLVEQLVGDGDRSLVVEELDAQSYEVGDRPEVSPLVDAAQTPPLLADRRVVIGRELDVLDSDALGPLVAYLEDPLPTTTLVLVWARGRVPKKLTDAIARSGGSVISAGAPSGKARSGWIDEQAAHAGVRLTNPAKQALVQRLGEDLNRVRSVLEVVAGTYGGGHALHPEELEPFLGEAGSVPPWELTDAIAEADIPAALDKLARMLHARHPLQIMGSLSNHYDRLLRLDGAEVGGEKDAAALLGISPYPAKKALVQSRRMGSARVARAIELLAAADLDLRGATGLPEESVLEVLVARLANLSKR